MNEAEAHERQKEACGVESPCMCKEFDPAAGVEHNDTNQVSMIAGGEQAAMKKRADKLHQSSVILNAARSVHASRSISERMTYWRYSICGKGWSATSTFASTGGKSFFQSIYLRYTWRNIPADT